MKYIYVQWIHNDARHRPIQVTTWHRTMAGEYTLCGYRIPDPLRLSIYYQIYIVEDLEHVNQVVANHTHKDRQCARCQKAIRKLRG